MIPALWLGLYGVVGLPLAALASEGPERAALFGSTWLGSAGEDETRVAVSWKGDAPVRIEIFEDRDGDGELGRSEPVALEQVVERGVEVLPVAPAGDRSLRVRWRGDAVGGVEQLGAAAQSGDPCEWQSGFSVGDLDDTVLAMAVWDDGGGPALYVGGSFTFASGVEVNGIAKWNGSAWSALSGPSGTGVGGGAFGASVLALAVWDDGAGEALYVGGTFTTAGGVTVNHLAKWSGFSWSALPGVPGVDGTVEALTPWDDGSGTWLYAGGQFTSAGGVPVNHIAKWDGGGWSALGTGVTSTVLALAVWADGSGETALYAGGWFTHAGEVPVNHVAKWNGAGWSALPGATVAGVSSGVRELVAWDDGTGEALYAGGYFTTAGGVTVNRIAKWTLSGWSALSGPSGIGVEGEGGVESLWAGNVGGGQGLYVGGYFALAGGMTVNNLARWDGSGWSGLAGPSGSGVSDPFVMALTTWDDGTGETLFAGGDFGAAGGVPASHVARWDGSDWSALAGPSGMGFSPYNAQALAVWDDGSGEALYAAGEFTTAGGAIANGVAKWDGTAWSALSGPSSAGVSAGIYALTAWDDGSGEALYAAGYFTMAGGVAADRVARWDGSAWSMLPGGGIDDGFVLSLAVWDDGMGEALHAGGDFTSAGGVGAERVAKWNGTAWAPLSGGAGANDYVWTLVPWDDGSGEALYVGGSFTTVDGVAADHIARWDGSAWSTLGPGLSFEVRALAVWDDGSGEALYAGGGWQLPGGAFNYIAKWDGSSWTGLVGPAGTGVAGGVADLTVWDDGSGEALYAGGNFETAGGVTVNGLAKWDGVEWSALSGPAGTGLAWQSRAGSAWALTGWDSGSGPTLYASGLFTSAGGQVSSQIAAYRCPVGGLLFADGFESGDASAWSAAVPGAPGP